DPIVHPQPEDYWGNVNPIGRRSCYDEGKRCAETLFFDYHRQHKMSIKVARIFNTYGPYMLPHDGRVVTNVICEGLLGEDITVSGQAQQSRSFCYVTDLIDGLDRFMSSPETVTGPINLGNPNEFTIRGLAEKLITIIGSKSRIIERPLPEDDPKQRQPNIELAEKLLGWRPTVSLDDGLERTITYFDALLREHGKSVPRDRKFQFTTIAEARASIFGSVGEASGT